MLAVFEKRAPRAENLLHPKGFAWLAASWHNSKDTPSRGLSSAALLEFKKLELLCVLPKAARLDSAPVLQALVLDSLLSHAVHFDELIDVLIFSGSIHLAKQKFILSLLVGVYLGKSTHGRP